MDWIQFPAAFRTQFAFLHGCGRRTDRARETRDSPGTPHNRSDETRKTEGGTGYAMKFEFSGSLLRYVGYARTFASEGGSIRAAIEDLCGQHTAVREILFDGDGRISRAHQFFLNGHRIAHEKH